MKKNNNKRNISGIRKLKERFVLKKEEALRKINELIGNNEKLKKNINELVLKGTSLAMTIALLISAADYAIDKMDIFDLWEKDYKIAVTQMYNEENKSDSSINFSIPFDYKDESGKKCRQFIAPGTIVAIKSDWIREGGKSNKAIIIDDSGELIEGKIEGKYLEEIGEIDEYTEYTTVYKVNVSKADTSIESEPTIPLRKNSKVKSKEIARIYDGEYVLGGIPKFDGQKWIPVKYINEEGNVQKGYLPSEYLREITPINILEEDLQVEKVQESNLPKFIVNTSSDGGIPLNMRSDKDIKDDNKIFEIPNGAIVEAVTGETETTETQEWIKVRYEYTDEEGVNIIVEGYVAKGYLEQYDCVEKIVDTSSDSSVDLNVRKEPNIESEIISTIANGTKIDVLQSDFENPIENEDGSKWIKITLSDGTTGYVSGKYLKDIEKNKQSEEVPSINVASKGKVIGIDSIGLDGEGLEQLLNNNTVSENVSEDIGVSSDKQVNFVYIKIGASGWGAGHKSADVDLTNCIEQIAVCEKYGIPYGYYYYSTCVTKDEAKDESERIKSSLDTIETELRDMGINTQNFNLLPFAVDIESVTGYDAYGNFIIDRQDFRRQETNPDNLSQEEFVEKTTKSKVYLSNLLQPIVGGKPIIYSAAKATTNADKIIDMDTYTEEAGYIPIIWYVAPMNNGNVYDAHQVGINDMPPESVQILQVKLDENINGVPVDVNMMDAEVFRELLGIEGPQVDRNTIIEENERV